MTEESSADDHADETHSPTECMACRGTGKVISHADEKTSDVTCPWCSGSGFRVAGVDAQQRWLSESEADGGDGEGSS